MNETLKHLATIEDDLKRFIDGGDIAHAYSAMHHLLEAMKRIKALEND